MCTEQLPPGGYPIAVKYIISYIIYIIYHTEAVDVPNKLQLGTGRGGGAENVTVKITALHRASGQY